MKNGKLENAKGLEDLKDLRDDTAYRVQQIVLHCLLMLCKNHIRVYVIYLLEIISLFIVFNIYSDIFCNHDPLLSFYVTYIKLVAN